MDIRELSPAIGVEVLGVDPTEEIAPEVAEWLRAQFNARHLLLFRCGELDLEAQVRLAGLFGPIDPNPDGTITSKIANQNTGGKVDFVSESRLLFHSDLEYAPQPLIGISLYGETVSDTSAPTTFANAVRALEQIPPALRRRIDSLSLMHIADLRNSLHKRKVDGDGYRVRLADIGPDASYVDFPRSVHPIVYVHPWAGVPLLFVGENQASHVIGLDEEESEVLILELFSYLYSQDNLYTHIWNPNDLVIWDNVALQHSRPANVGAQRTLRRVAMSERPHHELIQLAMTDSSV
jgi:taurine dioxygenase